MSVSEHANYLLNEYGRLQFDYAAYCKPYGESLRNEARNNLEEYIADLEKKVDSAVKEDEMSELKPCPFCGAMPTKLNSRYTCSTFGCALQENTVSAKEWNTRPIEDALNARIAELEAVQRWIPVSERLPEFDQDVFAIVEGDFVIGYFYEAWEGNVYFSVNEGDAMMVATHWMPLPKLPEVQE